MSVDISITKNKENKIKDALKSHFETEISSDVGICSYLIFPDGTLIGSYAHRDCLDYLVDNGVLSEEEINKWDTDIFNEVFDCVRATDIDANENYIGLPEKALTNAQYEMLEKWIDNNFSLGRPTLQVTTKFHTDNQTNAFYNYDDIIDDEWPTDYIIKKIKKYYATGKLEEDLDLQPVIEDKKYILNEIKEALDYAYNDLVVILDDYLFDFAEGNYLCWIFTVNESGELLELNDRHKLVKDINKSYGDDYNAAETTKYLKSWIDEVKGSSSEFENRGYYVDWLTNFLWGNGASYLEDDDREALEDKFGISFSKYLGEDSSLQEKIVKKGSKWQVQSEKGRNMGTYDTKAEAEKRLQQVHYFKYANEDLDLVAGDFSIPSSHNKNSDRYGHYNYKIEDPELKQRLVNANPHLEKFLDDHYVWYLMAWAKGINDGTTYQGFLNIYEDGAGWNRVHGSYSDGYRPEPDLVKDIVSNSIEEDLDLKTLPTDLNVDNVELVDVSPEKFIIKSDTIKEYIRDAVKEVVTQMKIFSNFRSAEDFADEAVEDEIYLCRVINRLSREEKWAITFEGNYLIFPVSDTFAAHIYSNEVTEDELENFVNDMVKLDEDLDLHPVALPDWKKYFYSDWFDVEGASFICWTDITLPQAEQYIERFRDENVWLVAKFDYDEYDWIYVNDGQLMSFDEAYDIFLSTELKPQCEIGLGLYMGSVDDEVHREILNIDDPEWEFDPWDEYTHLGFLHRKNDETNNEVDEDLELHPDIPVELPSSYKDVRIITPEEFLKLEKYFKKIYVSDDKPYYNLNRAEKAKRGFDLIRNYKDKIMSGEYIVFIGYYNRMYFINIAKEDKQGKFRCIPAVFATLYDKDFNEETNGRLFDDIKALLNKPDKKQVKEDLELKPVDIKVIPDEENYNSYIIVSEEVKKHIIDIFNTFDYTDIADKLSSCLDGNDFEWELYRNVGRDRWYVDAYSLDDKGQFLHYIINDEWIPVPADKFAEYLGLNNDDNDDDDLDDLLDEDLDLRPVDDYNNIMGYYIKEVPLNSIQRNLTSAMRNIIILPSGYLGYFEDVEEDIPYEDIADYHNYIDKNCIYFWLTNRSPFNDMYDRAIIVRKPETLTAAQQDTWNKVKEKLKEIPAGVYINSKEVFLDEDLELIPVGPKEEFTIVHKNDDTHDCKIKINDGAIIADLNKIVTDLDRDFTFDRFLDTMCSFIDSEHEGYVDIFTQYSSLVYELNFYVRGQRVRDFRIILASINNPHIVFGYDEENNSYEQEVNNTQIEIAKQIDALFGIDIVSNWLKEKDAEYDDVQANSVPGYVEDPIINEDLIPIPEKETSTTIIRGGELDGIVTLGTDAKDFVLDHIKELFPGVSPNTLMRINDEFIDKYYATWIYVPMDISDAFRSTRSRILVADRSYYVDSSVLEPYLKTIWKEVDYKEMLRKKQAEKQENNEN